MIKFDRIFFNDAGRISLLEDLLELLQEGMSIVEIAKDFERYGSGAVKSVGKRILESVGSGRSFSYAFEGYYNDITVQTLLAGELTQDIVGGCKNAIIAIQNTGGVVGQIIKALWVPVAQLVVIVTIVSALSMNIFPILEGLVPMYQWPSISKIFYSTVLWVTGNVTLLISFFFAVPILFRLLLRLYVGMGREFFDKLPIFSQFRYIVAAQVMFTMATILRSGGSLLEAVEFSERGGSRYQRKMVGLIMGKLNASRSPAIGEILDVGLLQDRQLARLKVLASAGDGNAARIQKSAQAHTAIIDGQIQAISSIFKSLVMAVTVIVLVGMLGAIMMLVLQARSSI
ncbi:type II secretion system F family protein [Vibrio sp. PNB22_3_1]